MMESSGQKGHTADDDSLLAMDALLKIKGTYTSRFSLKQQSGAITYPDTPSAILPLNLTFPSNMTRVLGTRESQELSSFRHISNTEDSSVLYNKHHAIISPVLKGGTGQLTVHQLSPLKTVIGTTESNIEALQAKAIKSSVPTADIRRDKVEKALRSKSQRGKKRCDLNENERMELTRTRNREHAKSTRIRKKARYQELLHREKEYFELKKKVDLQAARKKCVQTLIALRQKLFNNGSLGQDAKRHQESKIDSIARCKMTYAQELSHLVDSTFHINDGILDMTIDDPENALTSFTVSDNQLRDSAMRHFNLDPCQDFAISVAHKILPGTIGIALNACDGGFCQVETRITISPVNDNECLRDEGKDENVYVFSSNCSFTFRPASCHLSAFKWNPRLDFKIHGKSASLKGEDTMIVVGDGQGNTTDFRSQSVHPSVVSLDLSKPAEAENQTSPGMFI